MEADGTLVRAEDEELVQDITSGGMHLLLL